MARNELKKNDTKTIRILLESSKEARAGRDVANPNPKSYFEKIQEQRHFQKQVLFWFAIISSISILIGLVLAVTLQAYFRATRRIALFENFELQVLSGAVFVQVIGIIHIIAKAIWDESPFTKLLAEDLRDKKKRLKDL